MIIGMGDMALDSLYDALKVFLAAFLVYLLLSFFEGKFARLLEKNNRYAPLYGSLFGTIPQCGISVVGSDLFVKGHLTMGTLIAIYLACSDEALPLFWGDVTGKWYVSFILIGIKVVYGCLVGLAVDLFDKSGRQEVQEHLRECSGEVQCHYGCCGHEIEEKKENPWHEHLLHPLWHSFKIFVYAFLVSFFFGWIVLSIGEDNMNAFLTSNFWFSPLIAVLIGLIPNCASSVLITKLYLLNALPFGALLGGLSANAGLGPLYLFRKGHLKRALIIYAVLILSSIAIGYAFLLVNI
jgi:uncharacterized membrane protein YraQ (UPF0718 family)